MEKFQKAFSAEARHIDELGHVNNAVWVEWIQDIATSHWAAVAPDDQRERFIWVVTRHEIDYRGNIGPGESVAGETWLPAPPTGARFDRCVEFRGAEGKVLVSARTTWAMIDRASGRLARVREEVLSPFRPYMAEV